MTGKEKCTMLREIRRKIAEVNDIEFLTAECNYEGECAGTCPKCDAEIRYLDAEINRKVLNGEEIIVAGLTEDIADIVMAEQIEDDECEELDTESDKIGLPGYIVEFPRLNDVDEETELFDDVPF